MQGRNLLMPVGREKAQKKVHVFSWCPTWQRCADGAHITPLQPASGGHLLWWCSPQKMYARKSSSHTTTVTCRALKTGEHRLNKNQHWQRGWEKACFLDATLSAHIKHLIWPGIKANRVQLWGLVSWSTCSIKSWSQGLFSANEASWQSGISSWGKVRATTFPLLFSFCWVQCNYQELLQ